MEFINFSNLGNPFIFTLQLSIVLYFVAVTPFLASHQIKKIRGKENSPFKPSLLLAYLILAPVFSGLVSWGVFGESKTPSYIGGALICLFMIIPALITLYDSFTGVGMKSMKSTDDLETRQRIDKLLGYYQWFKGIIFGIFVFFVSKVFTDNVYISLTLTIVAILIVLNSDKKKLAQAKVLLMESHKSLDEVVEDEESPDDQDLENGFKIIEVTSYWRARNRFSSKERTLLLVGSFLFCAFLIPLEFKVVNETITAINSYVPTSGKVVEYVDYQETKMKITQSPVIEYGFKAQTYKKNINYGCDNGCYKLGETIDILVNPEDPSQFKQDSFASLWERPFYVGVFSLLSLLLPLFVFKKFKPKSKIGAGIPKQVRVESIDRFSDTWVGVTLSGRFEDLKVRYTIHCKVPAKVAQKYIIDSTSLKAIIDPTDYTIEVFWDHNDSKISMVV